MNAAILLLTLLCTTSSALCEKCGRPNRSHPPNLRTSGDRILGLKQGIVGGAEATPHSYPWMAWLRMSLSTGDQQCGGSLINDRWILTAAHCFYDHQGKPMTAQQVTVSLGTHDKMAQGISKYKARQLVPHPIYNMTMGNSDIALVQLDSRVKFGAKVQPICLPNVADNFQNYADGVVLAGWGFINPHNNKDQKDSNVLKHLVLNVTGTCEAAQADQTWMCATAESGSGCNGDSGGPLSVLRNGHYMQAGLVKSSGGQDGCPMGGLNLYTHVPPFMDWIKDVAGV